MMFQQDSILSCGLFALIVVSALATGSCTPARAQPIDDVVAPPPTCNDGVVWHRSADITFCATTCTSDIDCASGDRCRILDDTRKPDEGTLYADDVQDELLAAHEAVALADEEPQLAEPPACDEDCAPYSGDLEIKAAAPLGVCDPFHDIDGAVLAASDEAAIALAQ